MIKQTCYVCAKSLELSKFRQGRARCISCDTVSRRSGISLSYEAYLRNLHSQSKSARISDKSSRPVDWHLTPELLIALWEKQDGKCAISGVFLTHHKDGSGTKDFNASIDRINPTLSYTPENVQLVTYRMNLMKHTLSADMFYWWVKTIHDFSCD